MKQDVVVVQTSECKCEAFIARNNTFEECQGEIWVKNGKKTEYFQESHFSQYQFHFSQYQLPVSVKDKNGF